ncbi:MAG: hypothetical protein ACRBBW_03745 [Cellvibrionaceae bacterium]
MKRMHKSEAADIAELKSCRRRILRDLPIRVADGSVFQFDRDDEETIEGALPALELNPALTVEWRLLGDGDTVVVNHASLSAYLAELKGLRSRRGLVVDAEYMVLKGEGCTRRQLHDWEAKYSGGYVPDLVRG